ncbi:unnamed protein product [Tuber melanosporum]|uniref:(Perigord truffle) hypothetical protein n=1 Tax=Tuber melanosporum (strain Mel28) TaxID=656061 RepID=D5G8H8_TUBMM|nr:uncharacterized protein GSTUM_00002880001 [Tuber melanosporum]CAZ80825.1 unnamed protein product [Tuber melanosporum]
MCLRRIEVYVGAGMGSNSDRNGMTGRGNTPDWPTHRCGDREGKAGILRITNILNPLREVAPTSPPSITENQACSGGPVSVLWGNDSGNDEFDPIDLNALLQFVYILDDYHHQTASWNVSDAGCKYLTGILGKQSSDSSRRFSSFIDGFCFGPLLDHSTNCLLPNQSLEVRDRGGSVERECIQGFGDVPS